MVSASEEEGPHKISFPVSDFNCNCLQWTRTNWKGHHASAIQFKYIYKKGEIFYNQELSNGESTTTVSGVNYPLIAAMLLKYSNGQLLVADNHSQLWTLVSETEDRIVWPLPPPFTGQCPLSATCTIHMHAINQECSQRMSPFRVYKIILAKILIIKYYH